jgi:hypothetical protein
MSIDMKNYSCIFAASSPKTNLHSTICGSYFYGCTDAALSKDIRLSIHNGLLHSCCNLSLARCGGIAFSFLYTLIFHDMPKTMKNESNAKHSNITLPPDCESVNPSNLFNQLNLLPKQVENDQGIGSVDSSDVIGNNLSGSDNDVLSQTVSDSKSCIAIGNDANGSTVSTQTNHVQENCGVTGITGTGHTINIYQCPQELINLLVKSINKKL